MNVAPNQFQQSNFIDLVRDILMETGAHPRTIAMELTESAAVINPMRTAHMLEELRTMGVRVSLDDFGTGYSSLAHLQAMTFDALKIDGSFVMNQDETNTNWTIVKAMTSMAEAMDLRVVAEGIETEFQRSRLQEIGCKFGQGWLFDRALPEADALALLTSVTTGDGVPQEPHINPQVSKGWVLRSIRGQKLVADYCRGIILANAAVPEGVF